MAQSVAGLSAKRTAKGAKIKAKWSSVAGATSYRVRLGTSSWRTVPGLKVTFTKVKPKRTYKVSVVAVNAVGQSPVATVKVLRKK